MTRHIPIGIKTSPQAVDWATLDTIWARIGEHEVFESVWVNDHLTDIAHERHGASLESLTTVATLVHRVPGRWVGHGVMSATFRHPAVLAKSATVLDHATRGRFIVGLGAGWHEGEHESFAIPLPPMPERFERFVSTVHVLKALWSDAASRPPGVTRPDPFYPLDEATNEPPTLTPGGPPLWLGVARPRGIALAATVADGWVQPAVAVGENRPTTLDDFSATRDSLLNALEEAHRDPATFDFGAQLPAGTTREERTEALRQGSEAVRRGATHIILAMRPTLGAEAVDTIAREVAQPLRQALG